MTERDAQGQKGFLLYNPFTKKHFFRIYDPENRRKFKDYSVCAEDIEIEILSCRLSFYETEQDGEKNRLDWSSKVLGRKPK